MSRRQATFPPHSFSIVCFSHHHTAKTGKTAARQKDLPLKFLDDEALVAVLGAQNLLKVVGDAGLDALELGDAHGPEVLAGVAVLVLAAPDARAVGLALTDAGDVDEHAVGGVDPAGVDDVHAVAAVNVDVVRVDVEQVGAGGAAVGVDDVRVLGAVEVVAQPGHGGVGDLDVEVVVPRHDLAVPPPAQQRAVGQPRLDAVLVQRRQVAADQLPQHVAVLAVGDLGLEVALVVVAQRQAAAGLVEVLWRLWLVGAGEARRGRGDDGGGGEEGAGGQEEQRCPGGGYHDGGAGRAVRVVETRFAEDGEGRRRRRRRRREGASRSPGRRGGTKSSGREICDP